MEEIVENEKGKGNWPCKALRKANIKLKERLTNCHIIAITGQVMAIMEIKKFKNKLKKEVSKSFPINKFHNQVISTPNNLSNSDENTIKSVANEKGGKCIILYLKYPSNLSTELQRIIRSHTKLSSYFSSSSLDCYCYLSSLMDFKEPNKYSHAEKMKAAAKLKRRDTYRQLSAPHRKEELLLPRRMKKQDSAGYNFLQHPVVVPEQATSS
ncbi:hypothetical protein RND71_023216 [Anisodus tanguticus]|uniref:Uncharacterized protein n=1 Tax=Anisodus tanguticus TaxID=243964 RepID=A0AAE1RV59_9SOLA|nr:hypothetical protein RND71_023216 [Anisodus tanguticus]